MADERVTIEVDLQGDEKAANALRMLGQRMKGVQGNTRATAQEVKKGRQQFMGLVRGITRAAAVAGSMAAAFGVLKRAGAAAFAVLREGVQTAASFEFAIAKAAARTDATSRTLDRFREVAKSASATSAFGASQAAEGLQEMAKAGFTAQQSADALRGVLRQAAAANVEVGEAASTATGVLKSFGMQVGRLNEVNDVLVGAATTSKTTVQEMGEALGVVGSAANQAGFSLEKTAAIIAKMQDKNLSASRASIALRRAIAVLSDPTSQANKKIRKMGIELDKTASVSEQFTQLMDQLQASGNKVGNMAKVLGVRAGPTLQAAFTQGSDAIGEYTERLEEMDGRARKIEKFQLQNLQGTIQKLTGSWNNLVTDAMTPVSKALVPLAQRLLKLVNALRDNEKALKGVRLMASMLLSAMDLMVTTIGGVIGQINSLFQSFAKLARKAEEYGLINNRMASEMEALAEAMDAANQFTITTADGLSQATNRLRGMGNRSVTVKKRIQNLKATFSQLNKELSETAEKTVFAQINAEVSRVGATLSKNLTKLKNNMGRGGEQVRGELRSTVKEMSAALQALETSGPIANAKKLETAISGMGDQSKKAFRQMQDRVRNNIEQLAILRSNVQEAFKSGNIDQATLRSIQLFIQKFSGTAQKAKELKRVLSDVRSESKDTGSALKDMGDDAKGAADKIKELAEQRAKMVVGSAKGGAGKGAMSSAVSAGKGAVGGASSKAGFEASTLAMIRERRRNTRYYGDVYTGGTPAGPNVDNMTKEEKERAKRQEELRESFQDTAGKVQTLTSSTGEFAQALSEAMGASKRAQKAIRGVSGALNSILGGLAQGGAVGILSGVLGAATSIVSQIATGNKDKFDKTPEQKRRDRKKDAEAIADALDDDDIQGNIQFYDFSGATLLEGTPAIQKDIENANAQAEQRNITRDRLGQGGG